MRFHAISQIEINQGLVRDVSLFGQPLEIVDDLFLKPEGDLPFELAGIRVLLGFAEIVFFSHDSLLSYCAASLRVAFRAEIRRMTSSDSL